MVTTIDKNAHEFDHAIKDPFGDVLAAFEAVGGCLKHVQNFRDALMFAAQYFCGCRHGLLPSNDVLPLCGGTKELLRSNAAPSVTRPFNHTFSLTAATGRLYD
jgi:hypothetical protein